MNSRRQFLKNSFLAASTIALGPAAGLSGAMSMAPSKKKRPNVIFILIDDQDYQDLGCFGGKALTPNIDQLCHEGIRLDKCFATSPVCTPSRYSCVTGRYPERSTGTLFLADNPDNSQAYVQWNSTLEPDRPNVATLLKQKGYTTGFIGKWHLGGDETTMYYGAIAGNKHFKMPPKKEGQKKADFNDPATQEALKYNYPIMQQLVKRCGFDHVDRLYWDNPEGFEIEGLNHNMDWITEGAMNFIEQNRDKPFYMLFSTTSPHWPWDDLRTIDPLATPMGRLETAPNVMPSRQSVYERLEKAGIPTGGKNEINAQNLWLDDSVGAIMKKLKEVGLDDNTLVFYFSDNGRPEKSYLYKDGVQVPAIIRWKQRIKPNQTTDQLVGNIDFVPTILDACGVKPPSNEVMDGTSLLPLLTGKAKTARKHLFLSGFAAKGVVTDDWKYIAYRIPEDIDQRIKEKRAYLNKGHGGFLWLQDSIIKNHPDYWETDQLYNIAKDPAEKNNLAKLPEYADKLREMKQILSGYIKSIGRPFGEFGPTTEKTT